MKNIAAPGFLRHFHQDKDCWDGRGGVSAGGTSIGDGRSDACDMEGRKQGVEGILAERKRPHRRLLRRPDWGGDLLRAVGRHLIHDNQWLQKHLVHCGRRLARPSS